MTRAALLLLHQRLLLRLLPPSLSRAFRLDHHRLRFEMSDRVNRYDTAKTAPGAHPLCTASTSPLPSHSHTMVPRPAPTFERHRASDLLRPHSDGGRRKESNSDASGLGGRSERDSQEEQEMGRGWLEWVWNPGQKDDSAIRPLRAPSSFVSVTSGTFNANEERTDAVHQPRSAPTSFHALALPPRTLASASPSAPMPSPSVSQPTSTSTIAFALSFNRTRSRSPNVSLPDDAFGKLPLPLISFVPITHICPIV